MSPAQRRRPSLLAGCCAVAALWGAFALAQGQSTAPPPPAPASPARALPEIPLLGRVSLLQINESVDPGLAAFIKRVVEEHKEGELVLLEINTLGGRLDSALAIRDAVLETQARTVCWVKPRAISAGALIALACDVVVVTPGASMGAATPVQVGAAGELKAVDAKVVSYMRQEMANTARMQKRDPKVAEAMVDLEVEIEGLVDGQHLLTLDTAQALQFGMADLLAKNETELWEVLGRDPPRVERPRPTGPESLARFLSDPTVAIALMALGLLGVAVEIFHPMQGTALLFGLLCLGLFFFGHHVVNLSGWAELLLVAAGAVLVALEFAFPGHVFGVVGMKLILLGLFLALVSLDRLPLGVAWSAGLLPQALAKVMGALLGAVVAVALIVRYVPGTGYGRGLILEAVVGTPTFGPRGIGLEALVGQVGVALTDLRPFGKVEVINKRVEARVQRGFVSAGGRIRVLRVEQGRVVVLEEALETSDGEAKTG